MRMRIKDILLAVTLLTVFSAASAWAAGDVLGRKTLKGLEEIYVMVGDIGPEAVEDGLTKEQIQMDVELRLRKAGIQVEEDRLGIGCLGIEIGTVRNRTELLYAVSILVQFMQPVLLERDPSITTNVAVTWEKGKLFILGRENLKKVREKVADLVDKFINDYLAANPKK